MQYTLLNDGQTNVSKLSLGTWAFSGAALWGRCDEDDAVRTVEVALDNGINLFDTAEKYGDGAAEIVLGKALKGKRDRAVVATKVYSDHLHYDDILQCCEGSLKRLQTDYLDIMQIHWPNDSIPMEESFRAFEDLKTQGKIRMVSVCNFGLTHMDEAANYNVVLNQMPYSLIWRLAEHQISPIMRERQIPMWGI